MSTPSSSAGGDYRTRVVAMYQKYAPEKVGSVDAALEKYKGAEPLLLEALVKKYGPEPAAGASPACAPPNATFSPGDAVLAPWKKMTTLFRGTVQRDNGDGTYAIKFADGDFEPKQEGSTMRRDATKTKCSII